MSWPAQLVMAGTDALFRECLASRLAQGGRFEIAHHGGDFEAVLEVVHRRRPDVLIVDLEDPVEAATRLVRRVRAQAPEVKIVVLGDCQAEHAILKCIEAGAGACVSKETSLKDLCRVVERVLRGEAIYSPRIAYSMFERLAELSRQRERSERVEALELTPREMEILQLLAEGLSNRSIAQRLALSVFTVKNHVHHILEKLQVQDRREAVEHAQARHWLRPLRLAAG
jgi:DNA-binding NarL/FixJ family response regulator